MNKRDFKGIWIPKEVWLNKELKITEKIFLVEIDSLDNNNGCWASNKYFADFFGISKGRCSQIISNLEKKGLIKITLIYKGKEVQKRTIKVVNKLNTVVNKLKGVFRKHTGGYLENDQDNNTISNNTINNKTKKTLFKKPSIIEIKNYCDERNNTIDAEAFYHFYESKGWVVGKDKMKSWKSCIITWEKSNKQKTSMSKLDSQINAWQEAKKLL
tara:strand:+ start:6396 stop:7037 length:642 start_codon:yes stop_codon:yes gene_type:complete